LDDGCQSLAQALSHKTTSLQDIVLGNNDITDARVKYLAIMLETNLTLQHLNISTNRIGDREEELLARVLSKQCNQSLQMLYLNSNPLITDASVKYRTEMLQFDRQLNILWIQGCNLSDKGKHVVRKPGKSKRGNYFT
jgi:Ran GTPase-activating protein (RanGAP) involved in mRNA processing and transport